MKNFFLWFSKNINVSKNKRRTNQQSNTEQWKLLNYLSKNKINLKKIKKEIYFKLKKNKEWEKFENNGKRITKRKSSRRKYKTANFKFFKLLNFNQKNTRDATLKTILAPSLTQIGVPPVTRHVGSRTWTLQFSKCFIEKEIPELFSFLFPSKIDKPLINVLSFPSFLRTKKKKKKILALNSWQYGARSQKPRAWNRKNRPKANK